VKLESDNWQISNSACRKARKKISSGDKVIHAGLTPSIGTVPSISARVRSYGPTAMERFSLAMRNRLDVLPECHKRNETGALPHTAILRLHFRGDVDPLVAAADFHRPKEIPSRRFRIDRRDLAIECLAPCVNRPVRTRQVPPLQHLRMRRQ